MSWQFLWKILLEDVKPDSILEKKNYHLLLMIFLQALLMKPRRPVNQNKQILVKKISPIWHWFYIFQQNLSKKLLRQMLVRTEKGRTFIKWRTSRKNVHVIILLIERGLHINFDFRQEKIIGLRYEYITTTIVLYNRITDSKLNSLWFACLLYSPLFTFDKQVKEN